MNIVSMAAQYLSPMIIDKIASSLGITNPMAQKAIAALLPAILAALAGSASKPDSLGTLTKALGQQDPGLLGNLGNLIGGSGQSGLVNAGVSSLGSLFGNAGVGAMTGAVSKFAGIGDAPAKSLMGMLAPVALGTLAKQQKDSNLDASGLAKMLMSQKDNIAAALPPGFSDLLKGSGLLDQFGPSMSSSSPSAPSMARPAAAVVQEPARPPASAATNWLPWVAGLALLALAGWYYLGAGTRQASFPAVPSITVGNQDVGQQLGTVVEGLRGTLTGLKDEGSAKAALPRLQEMTRQLDGITALRGQLPAEGKKTLANYVATLLPLIRPLIDKALAGTGVAVVAKPILDQIFNRLEAMSKV